MKHPCTANFSQLEGRKQRANSGEVVRLSSGKVRACLAPEGDEQVALPTVPVASPVRVQGRARRGQGLMGAALLQQFERHSSKTGHLSRTAKGRE
jgi:hypothetical protein